jgi:hypothetical protein
MPSLPGEGSGPIPKEKITPASSPLFYPRNGSVCPVGNDQVVFPQTLNITELFSPLRIGTPHFLHAPVKQSDTILQPETGL